ncbi:DUF4033 domain-containing protein [Prochlorothrix hollandica]|uniref:Beta-carotene isomerase D27-like C-terminal domain-containing protein n=1 Tax=Prochlorothrix hollandica PCC 9006 = CALU 1027 TaxID=317619 RepID=A0A0M2PYC0_PROHO|nr:DUF4033 domain-containing protein [Prochlorothrix hollandica]KKJ01165.1 hypothetical protein PROH_01875 [Prochlorothrix hollandica PCC 9006 = CALU 1027]
MNAPETYRNNWLDRLFIWFFSRQMAAAMGIAAPQRGYDGFVELSQEMMQGRNAQAQQDLVTIVLRSLIPAPVLQGVRHFFSPSQWVCELNAWFATLLFEWLVGPCEVRPVEVTDSTGALRTQRSGVHIQKCRYLDQSRCVSLCINLCKVPTQNFFTQDFGIPVTLTPNFEDFSCEMVFGQVPPPLETEPYYNQPCLANPPDAANKAAKPCPGLRN